MSFTIIPNHAKLIQPCIQEKILEKIVKEWDYYQTEKNHIMVNEIWNTLYPHIPQFCDNEKLVGFDLDKTTLIKIINNKTHKISKKVTEKGKKSGNNFSLITLLICCNSSDGLIRFYDDKPNDISFENPEHTYYQSKMDMGNIFMFTNKISYEENICKRDKYILKMPIFYTLTNKKKFNKRNNIQYKKTYEIPSPNGEKYKKVDCVINLKTVTLTANTKNKINRERWAQVIDRPKILIINKYHLPNFIDNRKGRPPTNKEDYCPNCYEILPLNPIDYTNCSNCLSPIVEINEKAIKNKYM